MGILKRMFRGSAEEQPKTVALPHALVFVFGSSASVDHRRGLLSAIGAGMEDRAKPGQLQTFEGSTFEQVRSHFVRFAGSPVLTVHLCYAFVIPQRQDLNMPVETHLKRWLSDRYASALVERLNLFALTTSDIPKIRWELETEGSSCVAIVCWNGENVGTEGFSQALFDKVGLAFEAAYGDAMSQTKG